MRESALPCSLQEPSHGHAEPPIDDPGECRGTYEGAGNALGQFPFLFPQEVSSGSAAPPCGKARPFRGTPAVLFFGEAAPPHRSAHPALTATTPLPPRLETRTAKAAVRATPAVGKHYAAGKIALGGLFEGHLSETIVFPIPRSDRLHEPRPSLDGWPGSATTHCPRRSRWRAQQADCHLAI
jgi:hypothetical protein